MKQKDELKKSLQGLLAELEKLAEHLRASGDLTRDAEMVLCLKELVSEQIDGATDENSSHSAHASR